MQKDVFFKLQISESPEVYIQFKALRHIPVDGKDRYISLIVHGGGGVNQGYLAVIIASVDRRFHQGPQGRSPSVFRSMQEGPVDGLGPAASAVSGHDGGYDIYQLGQAGDLHPVGMPQEGDQHAARQKGVFEVIDVLQKRKGRPPFFPLPDLLVLFVGMVPDIPLVEGQMDLLFQVLLSLYRIADGYHRMDEVVQVHAPGQEARRIIGGVPVIAVEGYVIDVLIAFVQHGQFPASEGGHLGAGGSAGHQFNGRVHPLHHLCGFVGDPAVLQGGLVAHLPGPVHLVAKAPEPDPQGVLLAVGDAHVAEPAAAGMICILYNIPGVLRPPGPQVDGIHDLRICLPGPVRELMQAHLVGLGGEPGQIQPPGTFRSHAVLPVEAGNKVAAGIAHHRNPQIPYLFQHVPAEALPVRHGMARFINASVHRPAQMLDKRPVDPRVDPSDDIVLI